MKFGLNLQYFLIKKFSFQLLEYDDVIIDVSNFLSHAVNQPPKFIKILKFLPVVDLDKI